MRSYSLFLFLVLPLCAVGQRQRVSTDSTCGGAKGYTCQGSSWGNCCSQYGYCGSTTAYCAANTRQKNFGTCNAASISSVKISSSTCTSSTVPAIAIATQANSTNARCGPSYGGRTCLDSIYGNCCSQYSYCGSTNDRICTSNRKIVIDRSTDYCAADTCQKGFGKCNTVSLSSSPAQSSTSPLRSTTASRSISVKTSSSSASSTSTHSTSIPAPSSSSISTLISSETSFIQLRTASSLIPSSAISSSTSASPSPSPVYPYIQASTCIAYTGDLANSCPSFDNQCEARVRICCNLSRSSANFIQPDLFGLAEQQCAAACVANLGCISASFELFGGSTLCTLYTRIYGYHEGSGGLMFERVC